MFRSHTGQVTAHHFADERVHHRWVDLRGVEEPLVLVREQVRDALGGRAVRPRVDDSAVVAVELVTNALRHTRSGPTGLAMDVYEDTALLWVHDGDKDVGAVRPSMCANGGGSSVLDLPEDGRGLQLVAALADRWLVWPTAEGKAVVAEIGLTDTATAAPARREPAR
ncbi:ATP-binding protein [Streptomyces justiciae]|uniref:ATP-binding protein n=1 Tax=Streptomyces justiciae TaxID=2780140 RepID=UPI001883095C|nr:ATP-binding protein [Streptomyces justiciae]MBE8477506.1 ATP-binding protein [Streptomyces justiciae]